MRKNYPQSLVAKTPKLIFLPAKISIVMVFHNNRTTIYSTYQRVIEHCQFDSHARHSKMYDPYK